jgi:hypothetical protein
MYNDTAKNGFKTFVVTLSVSLLLFGALYYLITDFSSDVDIENTASKSGTFAYDPITTVKGSTTQNSVFGSIVEEPVKTQPAAVLAETDTITATETTESTVPDTGSETLIGTMISIGFFSAAVYILVVGPRKFAMAGFEKDMTMKGVNEG